MANDKEHQEAEDKNLQHESSQEENKENLNPKVEDEKPVPEKEDHASQEESLEASTKEVKEETAGEASEEETVSSNQEDIKDSETPEVEDQKKKDRVLESEHDLEEKDEHHDEHDDDHEDEDEIDYSQLSKKELVEIIKELAHKDNVIKAEKKAREIKPFYDEIYEGERSEALEKFKAEGGSEEDFSYKPDELDQRFEANYQLIRDKKIEAQKKQEGKKEENLKKKQDILERLRDFVDGEESNFSFDKFKEYQEEWKSVGPVPAVHARTLWANYNALVDRFYDNRSIYFELKELDRKKNLEAKLALCVKAEQLGEYQNIKEAIKELNELHHEFKHIGPVPKEEQEPVWQRFKAASDAVYARRKEYVENLKEELGKNEVIKRELGEKVQEFVQFDSDRIKAWNEKTKEILEIQKKWEATGGLPRAHAKEINKKFWNAFKKFFQHKSAFFKRLDSQREENLAKKQELVKKAQELKDSTDWNQTADKLKALQREWKEVGPVPEKVRDQVYHEFKACCDHFFDQKRANTNSAEKEYQDNLKKKEAILNTIEQLATDEVQDPNQLRELQDQYDEVGFVPKRDVSRIKERYTEVVNSFIAQLKNIDEEDKEKLKLESQIVKMKQGPNADHKLHKKEMTIRKQISKVENEIATYKNNLEFFASSKTADKLKDEVQNKIDDANDQLKQLKQQLKIIRNA